MGWVMLEVGEISLASGEFESPSEDEHPKADIKRIQQIIFFIRFVFIVAY